MCLSIFGCLLLLIVRFIYYFASQKCLAKSGNNVLNNRFEGGDWYMMINQKRLNLLRHSIQGYIDHTMYPVRYNCFAVWHSIRSYLRIKWIHGVSWAIFFSFLVLRHIAIHCRMYFMAVQNTERYGWNRVVPCYKQNTFKRERDAHYWGCGNYIRYWKHRCMKPFTG